MNESSVINQKIENLESSKFPLEVRAYENCQFIHCDFSNTDLSNIHFIDCTFIGCNMSLAKLTDTLLRDIIFKECKMLGLRFDTCAAYGISCSFENCQLNLSSFYQVKIKKLKVGNRENYHESFLIYK